MKTLKFKTNINCGSCVAKVTPFLNSEKDIDKWSVDVAGPTKILTVESSTLVADDVINILTKAGYKGEALL